MKNSEDIRDSEIRLIGDSQRRQHPQVKIWWVVAGCLLLIALAAGVAVWVRHKKQTESVNVEGIYESSSVQKTNLHPLRPWLYAYDDVTTVGCAIKDTIVNDIPVRVYLPLNATPALEIGMRPLLDNRVILAFQAADIRADNHKIVGAFVERGKPVAWGLSKKGYCAILNNTIYVGMADNSPLFEEATDCGGYFFRQYPLVADGFPQKSELKTQSLRRALCEVEQHICVVETQEKSSMHDFAELLADLGVDNAIYLIGSDAMGTYTALDGTRTMLGNLVEKPYEYTNFIYWTR